MVNYNHSKLVMFCENVVFIPARTVKNVAQHISNKRQSEKSFQGSKSKQKNTDCWTGERDKQVCK